MSRSDDITEDRRPVKEVLAVEIRKNTHIILFKGAILYDNKGHWDRLTSETFSRICYQLFGDGIQRSRIQELEHLFRASAPDYTDRAHLVQFGPLVWNTRILGWEEDTEAVYRSDIVPNNKIEAPYRYILELANNNEGVAHDILQAIAPLFMDKRPTGIIWFTGAGSNGKSSLINALYRIIGRHLVSVTLSSIEDGRDTPRLNGSLGNVVRESSEGYVKDSERYKALGTHEPFTVHKFNSQESIDVDTNLHTIFNANNIPIFADKTSGSRRRTLLVPFSNHFVDNPNFEDETFTPEFLGGLVTLVLDTTREIRDNNYKYVFSETTLTMKHDYDEDTNSAEAFYHHIRGQRVEAFVNYVHLKMAYQVFCDNGAYAMLSMQTLKSVMKQLGGVERKTVRLADGRMSKWYFFADSITPPAELISLDNGLQIGLKTGEMYDEGVTIPEQSTFLSEI